jgi:hypothetical protein
MRWGWANKLRFVGGGRYKGEGGNTQPQNLQYGKL